MSSITDDELHRLKISHQKQPVYKKLQPQSLIPDPPLPSIESFNLNKILSNELSSESSQVVGNVMNVAKNYRKDLQSTIKHKLMVEQKLQSKNTETVKLIRSMIKMTTRRKNKIQSILDEKSKTSSKVGTQVDQLLELSINTVATMESTADRVRKIVDILEKKRHFPSDGVIDRQKYPMMYSLLNVTEIEGNETDENVEIQSGASVSQTSPNSSEIQHSETEVEDNDSGELSNTESQVEDVKTNRQKQEIQNPKQDEDLNSSEAFEDFMASSISKYRRLQQSRRESYSVFKDDELDDVFLPINKSSSKPDDRKPGDTYHVTDNPLSLIYAKPSHGIFPTASPSGNGRYSFLNSMGIAKSPATVKSSSLVTHFKKLRINGPSTAPDSSDNAHTSDKGEAIKYKSNSSEHYLVDTLDRIKNLAGDSNSLFNSVLNENDADSMSDTKYLQFKAADTDETNNGIINTNGGVNNPHNTSKVQGMENEDGSMDSFFKDNSPTPKHEPSHYKLNPKKSILKIDKSKDIYLKSKNTHERTFSNCSDTSIAFTPPQNMSIIKSITPVTAVGTILPPDADTQNLEVSADENPNPVEAENVVPEDSDVSSIKSIPRLKNFLG